MKPKSEIMREMRARRKAEKMAFGSLLPSVTGNGSNALPSVTLTLLSEQVRGLTEEVRQLKQLVQLLSGNATVTGQALPVTSHVISSGDVFGRRSEPSPTPFCVTGNALPEEGGVRGGYSGYSKASSNTNSTVQYKTLELTNLKGGVGENKPQPVTQPLDTVTLQYPSQKENSIIAAQEKNTSSPQPEKITSRRTSKKSQPAEALPEPPTAIAAIWADFVEHRRELRKPLTARAARQALSILAPYPSSVQESCLRTSIASGWTGVFPPKAAATAPMKKGRTEAEIRAEYAAKPVRLVL